MRTRHEIETCGEVKDKLIMEVLLDIRDLLKKSPKEKNTKKKVYGRRKDVNKEG